MRTDIAGGKLVGQCGGGHKEAGAGLYQGPPPHLDLGDAGAGDKGGLFSLDSDKNSKQKRHRTRQTCRRCLTMFRMNGKYNSQTLLLQPSQCVKGTSAPISGGDNLFKHPVSEKL